MSLHLKLFNTTAEYNAYTADTSTFIKPNVSLCKDDLSLVHYNPLKCEASSVYEIVGTPSYPSTVDGSDSSFDITVNYRRTDIDAVCQETVTEGTDTITVECGSNPSTASSRTVSGTVDYHGNDIEYSVIQSKFEAKITAKFNVTDTSSPTKIVNSTSNLSAIEVDGVVQPSVVSAYTFNTTGEHAVKYTLIDPTRIVNSAFGNCYNLKNVTIPSSVTSIEMYAFFNCSGLTSIDIPSGVTDIGEQSFYGCSDITSIDIPSGVTIIYKKTFGDCLSLTSCTIGSGVRSIGESAFQYCTSLTSINIPSGVTSIGSSAFTHCSGLTSIVIPDNVTSVGDFSLQYCSGLTSVTIGSSVTSIGDAAFVNCTSLVNIISNAATAPTINNYNTFKGVHTNGTLYVPIGSSGYNVWMNGAEYRLGYYSWTKVEQ